MPPRALRWSERSKRQSAANVDPLEPCHLRRTPAFEHLPIIMITSRTAELHMQMARDAGVTDLLSKPYSEEELLNLLAAAIDNAYAFEEVRR